MYPARGFRMLTLRSINYLALDIGLPSDAIRETSWPEPSVMKTKI